MNRAYGSFLIVFDCFQWIKIRFYKIYRINWTKVQPYKMYRADGSMKCKSSAGTTNIVATDFNPL
jgi:hypothetical protein